MNSTPEFEKTVRFLESIGISIVERNLELETFLPGLQLGPNVIYLDLKKLKYPGDLIHEAGHIAVTTPKERKLIGTSDMDKSWPSQGDEIAAILWSFAVIKYLELPPEFVFHKDGYKGNSGWFIDNFTSGNFMGLPLLQWFQMAYSNDEISEDANLAFPAMRHWMRPQLRETESIL